jgi:hypothetical protein
MRESTIEHVRMLEKNVLLFKELKDMASGLLRESSSHNEHMILITHNLRILGNLLKHLMRDQSLCSH